MESFFNFKLYGLKQKWLEFCNLLKTNATLIERDVGSQELLKFLILNLTPKFECLILDFNKMVCFQNDFSTKICELKANKRFVLGVIVENYAKKILTVGLKDEELKAFLTEFFDEKVEFC